MKSLVIKSALGKYKVHFCNSLLDGLNSLNRDTTHYLIDRNIYQLYKRDLQVVQKSLSIYLVDAKEKNKSLESVTSYIKFLLAHNVHKDHTIAVIGGGLVQDIGSFTAHTLLRSIDWVFFPTTLLSMADSCIGAKSGINVGKYKNQVGSFHPPQNIYIFADFLKSLSSEMILDGNGEIIKHAIIKGGNTYRYLINHLSNIQNDKRVAVSVIHQSLTVKKKIVEKDEFDRGIRKVLNYGHTFGHALEGYTNNRIIHGVGVSIGMDIANFISMRKGMLSQLDFETISKLLHSNIPIEKFPVRNTDRYFNFITHDKKVVGSNVLAILCNGIGRVRIVKIPLNKALRDAISAYAMSYRQIRHKALAIKR